MSEEFYELAQVAQAVMCTERHNRQDYVQEIDALRRFHEHCFVEDYLRTKLAQPETVKVWIDQIIKPRHWWQFWHRKHYCGSVTLRHDMYANFPEIDLPKNRGTIYFSHEFKDENEPS